MKALITCAIFYTALYAQKVSILETPPLGWAWQSSPPQVRPIFGVPSAARLGIPMLLPEGVTYIQVAPRQQYAAIKNAEGRWSVLNIDGGSTFQLPGALAGETEVAFSPTGASMALYETSGGRLQVWTGLPAEPKLSRELGVARPDLLAIADDGEALLIAEAESLKVDASILLHAVKVTALAFVPNSRDAVFSDSEGKAILISDVTGQRAPRILAPEGMNGVAAMAVLDSTAYFAIDAGRKLLTLPLRAGEAQSIIDLPDQVGHLYLSLGGRSFLASNLEGGKSLIVVSTAGEAAMPFYVPGDARPREDQQ